MDRTRRNALRRTDHADRRAQVPHIRREGIMFSIIITDALSGCKTELCRVGNNPEAIARAAQSKTIRIGKRERRNLTVSTAGKSAQERSEWDDRFMRRVWLRLSSSSRAGADRVFGYCDR